MVGSTAWLQISFCVPKVGYIAGSPSLTFTECANVNLVSLFVFASSVLLPLACYIKYNS